MAAPLLLHEPIKNNLFLLIINAIWIIWGTIETSAVINSNSHAKVECHDVNYGLLFPFYRCADTIWNEIFFFCCFSEVPSNNESDNWDNKNVPFSLSPRYFYCNPILNSVDCHSFGFVNFATLCFFVFKFFFFTACLRIGQKRVIK